MMIQTLINWLTLDAHNLIVEVWWAALILWSGLLVIGIADIATHTLSRSAKIAWIAAVLLLPLAGLFAYSIFCLTRADYHMLEFLFLKRKGGRRKTNNAPVLPISARQ